MKPTAKQLEIINSRLPGTRLSAEQVEVLPFRVFDNKVTDRYTIMSKEMMEKLVFDLNAGHAAFNRLHQSNTTLPVGRSVNAKLVRVPSPGASRGADQMDPNRPLYEVHANMYAVIQNHDGTPSLDGKEIVDKYNTGSVYACSAGVQTGFYKCNICGNDIRDWQKCDHMLGRKYSVDEKPKLCMALMTGHDIQDGVAMDCGVYEVSAVTAGGVANAGVLTQTFGHYSEGTDLAEFKKSAFADNKEINARITFEAMPVEHTPEPNFERNDDMALDEKDVKAMIDSRFGTIEADKAKLEVEYKHLDEKYKGLNDKLTAAVAEADKFAAEITSLKEDFAAEKVKLEETFAAEKATMLAEKEAFTAEKATLEAFKAEYIDGVVAAAAKIGKTTPAEDYTGKSLDELKAISTEYADELNRQFPDHGRQSTAGNQDVDTYSGIPDSAFKTDK